MDVYIYVYVLHWLFLRYVAVHNPLDYNQAMTEGVIRRLMKYLLPVVVASIVFNIPKFLESKVSYATITVSTHIITGFVQRIQILSFRLWDFIFTFDESCNHVKAFHICTDNMHTMLLGNEQNERTVKERDI